MKNVTVIGLGYVGLPLALLASRKGYKVFGVDLNKEKVAKVNSKIDPINDQYVNRNIKGSSLIASADFSPVEKSEIVIVCVPTPVKHDFQPDLSPVKEAVKSLGSKMKPGTLVIIESTINPGVCDEVVIPLLVQESGLKINKDFQVSHCPERINPGDEKWSVENIPRVTGSSGEEGLRKTVSFYESILDAAVRPMASIKEAEACKVVENSFRDINIAFVNELAKSFTKLGINVKNVIDGAATKPFAFMPHYPSIGVGGHCIPVDPYYLIEYARGYGFDHEFLSLARSINNSMPEFAVEQLTDGLSEAGKSLSRSRVAVLGLSYKPNVADDRESPTYKFITILEDKGVAVTTYDPYFLEKSSAKSIQKALQDQDAIVVATNHKEFVDFPFVNSQKTVFVDGKNSFNSEVLRKHGFIYRGMGT